MTIKSLLLALLIAALGGSLCAQTPNGGYSSPAAGNSSTSGAIAAAPIMGIYFGGPNACQSSNIGSCINTFADTQQADACSWSNVSTTVTCLGYALLGKASVTTNVATYTSIASFPSNWVAGNSVTITGYGGGDAFFNQTCTISTATTAIITCPLVHANGTAGQTTAQIVNSTVGPFLATDVGKSVMGAATCAGDQYAASYGNVISAAALPTISTFVSATQVTISSTPSNSNTQSAAYPAGGCFIWGHPDDAGFANLWTAASASLNCPKIFLAAAYYMVQAPPQILWGNPYSCPHTVAGVSGGFGNTTLPAGMEVEGRGVVNTQIFLTPNFPNGDTGTHLASSASTFTGNLQHAGSFFALPLMGKWQDFAINGGYQISATALNGKTLISGTVATIQNFSCFNYGAYTGGNSIGIETSFLMNLILVNNVGCGSVGWWQDANTGGTVGSRVIVENSSVDALLVGAASNVHCYNVCVFALPDIQPLGNSPAVQNQGGTLKMYGGFIQTGNGAQPSLVTTTAAYQSTGAASVFYGDGVFILGNLGTNNSAIKCTSTCINHLIDSTVTAIGTGNSIVDVAGSVTNDLGSNTISGGAGTNISGTVVGSQSIAATPVVAGNFVPSANFGTGAAVSAVTGNATNFTFTLTNGSAAVGANPTIAFTFPLAFYVNPSKCTLIQVGGTQAITATTTTLAPSAQSATGVTFTYNGTPTINLTEFFQGGCVN